MNKSLAFVSSGLKGNVSRGNSGGIAPITVNYTPTINFSGNSTKDDFSKMLKEHKDEIVRIIQRETERQMRLAY